jgi:hypothetical protein
VFRAAEDGRERQLAAHGRTICAIVDLSRFAAIPAPERITALLTDLVEPDPGDAVTSSR